jgi:pyruvate-formate lyase-activating enzyme
VESLLSYGEQTCNARLIELAGQLLKRHREKIEGVKALIDTQGVLSRRYCVPCTHIAGIRRSGRSSGGMLVKA